MSALPHLTTRRLVLRPFDSADAPAVRALAGDRRVAETTAHIPHPYEEGVAEAWIATHEGSWCLGRGLVLALTVPPETGIIGAIGLRLLPEQRSAELGYWLGVPYWGRGYGTEAARALINHGFGDLALHRIHARRFGNNPASGRVLEKAGMRHEGCLRDEFLKWGRFLDVHLYGILRSEWEAAQSDRGGKARDK